MELVKDAFLVALGASLGFDLTLLERKRAQREAEKRRGAAWRVAFNRGMAWILTNTGDARAADVELSVEDAELAWPTHRFDLEAGESIPVRVHVPLGRGENPQLVIQWTSHRGDRMGPVRRLLVDPPA